MQQVRGHRRDSQAPAIIPLVSAAFIYSPSAPFWENFIYAPFFKNSGGAGGEESTTLCHLGWDRRWFSQKTPDRRQRCKVNKKRGDVWRRARQTRGEMRRKEPEDSWSDRSGQRRARWEGGRKTAQSEMKWGALMHHYLSWQALCCSVAPGKGFALTGVIQPEHMSECVYPLLNIVSHLHLKRESMPFEFYI